MTIASDQLSSMSDQENETVSPLHFLHREEESDPITPLLSEVGAVSAVQRESLLEFHQEDSYGSLFSAISDETVEDQKA